MLKRPILAATLALTAVPAFAAVTTEPTKEQADFFENKIRPILKENCYKCHSVEAGKAKGDLTLDTKAGFQKGGENGKIVIPGDVVKSPLIVAINYKDADLQMPPKGEKLTDQQIADLTAWVKMGAPDPRKDDAAKVGKLSGLTDKARSHWAYQPVTHPTPPAVKNRAWPKTTIDQFVLAKLEDKGMFPMPDASKEALLRRATYDLTGLPPSPAEVQAFVADTTPLAFSKVVDRLLASPAYGERWGRHWLDTARYSDTTGGEKNLARRDDYRYAYAWTYRDWVIKAFNDDLPYNQFILQQLAADRLPNNPATNLAALGFLTVGERFRNVNDIINDRIDVVTKGFLGLTVACARCHDHMFDPIPTKDYYALHGIFASTIEPPDKPVIAIPSKDQLADYEKQVEQLNAANRDLYYKFIDRVQSDFFKKIDGYLQVAHIQGGGGKKKGGGEQEKQRIALLQKYDIERELIPLFLRHARGGNDEVFVPFRRFAELSPEEFADKAPAILTELASGSLGPRKQLNPLVVAAFKDAQIKSLDDVLAIYKQLFASLEPQRKAYLAANAQALTAPVSGFTPEVVQLLEYPTEIMPASQINVKALREFNSKLGNKLIAATRFEFAKFNELELTHPGAPARAMLVADAPTPRNSPVFIRGQAETRGDIVPRHFLEILSPDRKPQPFKEGSGRLELAESIASKTNPLTARVIVNRVWMYHFGEGFVRTLDDLGVQSETPTHQELLDYLAGYFMDQGWSLKKLHKAIMLSHVYQESSDTNAKFETMDPENRLLWRANVRRLDFESLRDSLLTMCNSLDKTVGGKPVNLTEEPYSYRRSVYGYIDRGNLPELMQQFDFSDPDMPNSRRASTIVPQQALFLMNSPMAVDVARKIVSLPQIAGAQDALARVINLYKVVYQRNPTPQEIQLAVQFVAMEEKNQPAKSPAELKGNGNMQAANKRLANQKGGRRYDGTKSIQNTGELVDRKPLNGWETYTQALLLSNEASYVN